MQVAHEMAPCFETGIMLANMHCAADEATLALEALSSVPAAMSRTQASILMLRHLISKSLPTASEEQQSNRKRSNRALLCATVSGADEQPAQKKRKSGKSGAESQQAVRVLPLLHILQVCISIQATCMPMHLQCTKGMLLDSNWVRRRWRCGHDGLHSCASRCCC